MTTIFEALEAEDDARARELAERDPRLRGQRDDEGLLPAVRAVYSRSRELANALLPSDLALNAYEAAVFGRIERLRDLLETDPAAANALSPDGFTPLHGACYSGGVEATRLLVERGAELETVSQHSFIRVRPLGTAAFSRDGESALVLLEAGADPNGRGEGGFTPLFTAAQNGDMELVRLLLQHGADPSLALDDGRTPADFAREAGHSECAELLEARLQPGA